MAGTVEIQTGIVGSTLTLTLFPDGSDLSVLTGGELTEATYRKGLYFYSNASLTGLHLLHLYNGSTLQWSAWAVLKTSGTITASETREAALLASGIGLDGKISKVGTVDTCTTNSDMRGTDGAVTSLSGIATSSEISEVEAKVDDVKEKTDQLDFSGTGGVLKSQSTNMRGTDNAITSLSGVALEASVQALGTPLQAEDYTAPLDATGTRSALGLDSANLDSQLDAIGDLIGDVDTHLDEQDGAIEDLSDDIAAESVKIGVIHGKMPTSEKVAGSPNADGSIEIDVSEVVVEHVTVESFAPTAIQQLAGTRQIHVSASTLLGKMLTDPLVQGDAYLHSLGSAIEFSRSDFPDIPDESAVQLRGKQVGQSGESLITINGSIPVAEGAKVVRLEATSEESSEWTPGKYEFQVEVTFPSGEVRSFVGPGTFLEVLSDV